MIYEPSYRVREHRNRRKACIYRTIKKQQLDRKTSISGLITSIGRVGTVADR